MLLQMIRECSFNKHIIIYSSVFLVSSTTAQSSSNNSSSTPSGGDIVTDESPQNFEDSPQKVATVVCSFIAGIIIFLSLKWARLRYLAKLQEEEDFKNGKGHKDGLATVACEACENTSNSILADSRIPIQAQLQILTLRQQHTRTSSASVNPTIKNESIPKSVVPRLENL